MTSPSACQLNSSPRQSFCRAQAENMAQVYSRLTERLGMADHLMVLNAMLGKVAVNLKVYGPVEDLIQQTLSLFQVAPIAASATW